jgi:hypothetical protein
MKDARIKFVKLDENSYLLSSLDWPVVYENVFLRKYSGGEWRLETHPFVEGAHYILYTFTAGELAQIQDFMKGLK